VWFIADWRLTRDGRIAAGFGNRMEAAMDGRLGNLVTLNGQARADQPVRAGERIRLRLVNGAVARIMALSLEGHRPTIVAVDGQPCEPHQPDGGRILLGPAMRVDLMLDLQGEPGRRYAVIDDFYDDDTYEVTALVYDDRAPIRKNPRDEPLALPRNPLPPPDLATAEHHEFVLEGGMMGGRGMMGMMGRGSSAAWAINGMSMTGDGQHDMPPGLKVQRGRTVVLKLRNDTAWWHPMHLHGHSFRVLSRNGTAVGGALWGDTVLVEPRQSVEVAFVADNPGNWMLHCHVVDHQVAGMMTILRVA
jgi:FtsP/CotA-like multicopper oxidase with cupredoxin domain